MLRIVCGAALVFLPPPAITFSAQDLIPDEPSCAQCSIATESLLTIGGGADSVLLPDGISAVEVDARGRYWLASRDEPILVFNEDGSLAGTVGRVGDGPGEFRWPAHLAMTEDSAIVFDSVSSRVVVFDLDFRHVRTVSTTNRRLWDTAAIDGSDTLLVNGTFARNGVRLPFKLLDLTASPAKVLRTFGPDLEDRSSRSGVYRLRHVMDAPRRGGIWVAETRRYHVSKWSFDGELQESLMRQPEWFSGFSTGLLGGPSGPTQPQIFGIATDASGRLWVFLVVAAPDWREVWSQWIAANGSIPEGEVGLEEVPALWDLTDTMVEVLDPQARRVVHRQRLDVFPISILPGPRLATYSEREPDFEPILEVVELRLQDRGR